MKNLLFFIFIFSIILSVNINANPKVKKCLNGNIVGDQAVCPEDQYYGTDYYGALAADPNTGDWSKSAGFKNKEDAKDFVLKSCNSKNCKLLGVLGKNTCGAAAYSSAENILEYDQVSDSSKVDDGHRRFQSEKNALKKCEKKGGKNCKILTSVCDTRN